MTKALSFIHPTAIIDSDVKIGFLTHIWHFCHIEQGAVIGENCTLGHNVYVGKNVIVGNGCKIQNNVSLFSGVTVKDDVFIGPSVTFTNVHVPRAFIPKKDQFETTIVEQGASIGANSTIISGISIGKYAIIGAGSVVTKNVPPYCLVFGNPARLMAWVSEDGETIRYIKA